MFSILTSVRGLQVLCRDSDQCQGHAGTLTSARGFASTLISGIGMQVLCRDSDQCQGYAGTLQVLCRYSDQCQELADEVAVRSGAELGPLSP